MNLALFDFDGTITTRETFPDFIGFAVSSPVRLVLGKALLAPLIGGYRRGWVSGNCIRASAVRVGMTGMRLPDARDKGYRFAHQILPTVLREVALDRIAWHKAQGDRVVVVSGGLDLYLFHWCQKHDLELICSELAVKDGILTGRYAGLQCVGFEKARRVREAFDMADYEMIYAYGDTKEDFELLGLAHRRTFRWKDWIDQISDGGVQRQPVA